MGLLSEFTEYAESAMWKFAFTKQGFTLGLLGVYFWSALVNSDNES